MPTSHPGERARDSGGAHQEGRLDTTRHTIRNTTRTASKPHCPELSVAASAWLMQMQLPLPQRQDHIVFLRGVPVAPWMTQRPWHAAWTAWLARLEALFAEWEGLPAGHPPERVDASQPLIAGEARAVAPMETGWQRWRESHVHSMEARRVERGIDVLRQMLSDLTPTRPAASLDASADASQIASQAEPGGVHLIGHSVGGAVILSYLAQLREDSLEPPTVPLRSALTLDAAVSGLAGAWSGAKSYLHRLTGYRVMAEGMLGLNQWAADQGIRVLTVSNSGDIWSHNRLADLPYLGVHLGSRLALADQLNGTIHDWLRRTPEFVEAIWSPQAREVPPAG